MLFRKKKSALSADAQEFVTEARKSLEKLTGIHTATWGLGKAERYDVDLEKGEITFTFPDKIVTSPVQVIGTLYNNSFMWGWDHPSVPASLQKHAQKAKAWGMKHNATNYVTQVVPCTTDEAWDFAALTCAVANASGVYCAVDGSRSVFMTLGKQKLRKN